MGRGRGCSTGDWAGRFGEVTHTLTMNETPLHTHGVTAGEGVAFPAQATAPTATSYLGREKGEAYNAARTTTLAAQLDRFTGNSLPHANIQPDAGDEPASIAQFGVFPSRN